MNPANPISPDSFVNVTASETVGHESNHVGQLADVPRLDRISMLPTPSAVPPWGVPVPTPSAAPVPTTSAVFAEEYPRLERIVPCHIIIQIHCYNFLSYDKIIIDQNVKKKKLCRSGKF
jgi:hypothetical protein